VTDKIAIALPTSAQAWLRPSLWLSAGCGMQWPDRRAH